MFIQPEDVCLIVHDSFLEFMPNSLSGSDGDLPLAIQDFMRDSLNLDLIAKNELDHNMSCPLIYNQLRGMLLEMYFHLR